MSATTKKDLNKDGKAKKTTPAAAARKPPVAATAGFGRAKITKSADATWLAAVTCINGNPRRATTNTLPSDITFYGGAPMTDPADTITYLPDGAKIDTNYIFPWSTTDPDPLRLGGGIIKGQIIEGAQRQNPKPTDPIQAPYLISDWANGSPYRIRVYIPAELGVVFYPGDLGYALIKIDTTTGQGTAIAAAKSEGDCV